MMTREEYDERNRLIEEQHRATIELIEAGRPVRMLESGASTEKFPREPEPAPAPARRRGVYKLLERIEAALPSLPEVFDYHDLCRALGIELDRGAVRRNLQLLVEEEILAKEGTSSGRFRLFYRKLAASAPPADD